ncbi:MULTISPECIES: PH domain-containing protein [Arthrobacter]|uniref:PH domain-containing protein n=1 Tax=Arthrobacter terricola TaxID=2547396 RepID=A0A4R5L0S6_9MICC|nr:MULTISPECIES: PH domain-containing protein [Arthrobacter]MBT8158873.1 PH domain-containing protein [Arthrobacter sp. GN70]TDG01557.1 PH domain-containing protein [Arthrobacter terricola]
MSPEPHAGNVEIFKARTSKLLAWTCWAVAAIGIIVTLAVGGPRNLPGTAPLLLLAFLGWLLFWRPAVLVMDSGVTLENPYRTIDVPWDALVQVDTRYALTLMTPHKKYPAWAAPAPGIWGGRNARPEHLRGLPETTYGPGSSVRPGDLRNTDSGAAAVLVRARWRDLVESGRVEPGRAEDTAVAVRIEWLRLGGTIVLAAASYWAIFIQ